MFFFKSFSYMNLQGHIQALQQVSVLAVFWQNCSIFHNSCWSLCSKRCCLKEWMGCSMDFPTEFLSCLRSSQRSSSMRVRSPRSIPTYKLRFQPQSSARGSEVDAARNVLGAGMRLGSNPPSQPPPKMLVSHTSQGLDRCCAVGAIV